MEVFSLCSKEKKDAVNTMSALLDALKIEGETKTCNIGKNLRET